ncbi:hypothetical protein A0J46_02050 [Photobacterium damselae subsp. damselae]|nr:hypothetical protein A0J46_02050 [Photobacterium damselae subsp. damselae]
MLSGFLRFCVLKLSCKVRFICIAALFSLRDSSYPNEFKLSLLTSDRKTAYLQNIEQVQLLHALFNKAITTSLNFSTFKAELSNAINELRKAYKHQLEIQT